ncbi:MAG: lipase maturation factor family protein [Candidatus Omnitrophica bacterium]|nr:lipase maturation factor family protein [Candidatus Omnitrophota bacterium]
MIKKPLLIYDGDCGFCRRWIDRWHALTGDRIDYEPYQKVTGNYSQIPLTSFQKSVQLIDQDDNVFSGAHAVFRTLWLAGRYPWLLWLHQKFPFFKSISEWFYAFVANHRPLFSRLTKIAWGDAISSPTYFYSRSFYLRLLGVVYLIAFISLGSQIKGLVGANGILPFGKFLDAVSANYGVERYWLLPTLAWLFKGDAMLLFLTGGGALLSLFLIAGLWPSAVLFFLWFFYLSLVNICRDFLSFQWDVLLLEAGFIAIFLSPGGKWLHQSEKKLPPSPVFVWLTQWLLFRLMFSSGMVKLLSGDPAWRNLTALAYHYGTQPLPTWIGWYVHHFPPGFHKFSALIMFLVELGMPFLIFSPRRLRLLAAFSFISLQAVIGLTGNYCFFNLLAIFLCLFLVDDQTWQKIPKLKAREPDKNSPVPRLRGIPKTAAALLILFSVTQMINLTGIPIPGSRAVGALYRVFSPFHWVNSYGLFAVMTIQRPEIMIEGSNDKENWEAYEFRYKPGDLKKKPGFVAPHQPRLDWQMWFAALGHYKRNPWFVNFCVGLLQGSPDVLALLKKNPFPDTPPRYIRARLYDYRFTDLKTQKQFGFWWERNLQGLYCPIMSLKQNPS